MCIKLTKRSKSPRSIEASPNFPFLNCLKMKLQGRMPRIAGMFSRVIKPNYFDSEMKHLPCLQREDSCESHTLPSFSAEL